MDSDFVIKHGKLATGKRELIAHLNGSRLSPMQAMKANCYMCMGYYADGKVDCGLSYCPIHPFMPYNKNRTKRAFKGDVKKASEHLASIRGRAPRKNSTMDDTKVVS